MKRALLIGLLFLQGVTATAQEIEKSVEERLQTFFQTYSPADCKIGKCKLDSIRIDFQRKQLYIYANERLAYQPWRNEQIARLQQELRQLLPGPVTYFDLRLYAGGRSLEELVPNFYRKGKKEKERMLERLEPEGAPWVTRTSRPYEISRGLAGKHIALWQSHGSYYKNQKGEWGWQRPRLFCTTEDLFTQSFVLPYLLPMLENAGAVVYTPRERDTQRREVIVDNDGTQQTWQGEKSLYLNKGSRKAPWKASNRPGFAARKAVYNDRENPFVGGTARIAMTEKKKNRAFAEWVPDIPETGEYAVYVSYQTLPNSVSDAKYLVFHNGGVAEFKVNQQIGGGTWVYLGTFGFDKGRNDYGMVVLSNESKEQGVVCADAVRFGGGMGNIAREGKTSGLPRYLEGARYAMQWAGMPYAVYAGREGTNDLADDINVRSRAVNYLSGRSVFNPDEPGLGVPFEMSMALHSDAGFSRQDEIIGTLGIYTTNFNDGRLNAGTSRQASRDLADLLLTELQRDIRAGFNTGWTRRSLWDRNYSETRLPAVASSIVELLSHQNFADMRLGHDPNFKFTASRALYKGILKYLCSQHGEEYVVQPLPVSHFAVRFGKRKNTVELSWKPVEDPLEPSARPREYIVYTRVGRGGFDNGVRVSSSSYTAKIEPGISYSFKVTAVNRGGESFPSEILTACQAPRERGRILIVNGFDRLSGPAVVDTPQQAGFDLAKDPGIPYLYNISLCGAQQCFDRKAAGKQLGESGSEYEGMKIAGNSFDYPFVHGKAIQAAGRYSYVSCSDEAVESGRVALEEYEAVDYILGLEKEEADSHPVNGIRYKSFSPQMQRLLDAYCQAGGALLVSGAYVGNDMNRSDEERRFTTEVLKLRCDSSLQTAGDKIQVRGLGRTVSLPRLPNERQYAVTSPDCLVPQSPAFQAMVYDNGKAAAVAYPGQDYRSFVLAFPFESIDNEADRNAVMASVLRFLLESPK